LKDRYFVTGYVKPGARLENLKNTVKHERNKRIKDDHPIFGGGANNISRTSTSESLITIFRHLQGKHHTNVTVVSVPQCFELNVTRDVNEETKNLNRKKFRYQIQAHKCSKCRIIKKLLHSTWFTPKELR
jgi:hypothetical protein